MKWFMFYHLPFSVVLFLSPLASDFLLFGFPTLFTYFLFQVLNMLFSGDSYILVFLNRLCNAASWFMCDWCSVFKKTYRRHLVLTPVLLKPYLAMCILFLRETVCSGSSFAVKLMQTSSIPHFLRAKTEEHRLSATRKTTSPEACGMCR